jgi:hypothetical protein
MMFGHDDNQHNDEHKAPAPDAVLAPDNNTATAMPPAPLQNDDDAASDFIMTDTPEDRMSVPAPSVVTDSVVTPAPKTGVANDDLLQIKQEAMQQLSPILDHLEQAPEEKFRTTMMMIQASDNDKLIPVAYEAAKAISDEKVRAQALLDIVNEINYFTQGANSDADKA